MIKVYAVEFRKYTNAMRDTVSANDSNSKPLYIDVSEGPFLIFEDEIEKYKNYGEGIEKMTYVGSMLDYDDRVYGGK